MFATVPLQNRYKMQRLGVTLTAWKCLVFFIRGWISRHEVFNRIPLTPHPTPHTPKLEALRLSPTPSTLTLRQFAIAKPLNLKS